MEAVRQYILSVVSVALICALLQALIQDKSMVSSAIKMIIGVVMTVAVLNPLLNLKTIVLEDIWNPIAEDGQYAVAEGEDIAMSALAGNISDSTEAYIIKKAKEWGMEIDAEVSVDSAYPPLPNQVRITGGLTPYGKKQLSQYITTELGIAEENQIWIS